MLLPWLGALWLLWLPGMLLTRLFRLPRSPDGVLRFALQVGLGLAFWPTFFLWTTQLGWRWTPTTARGWIFLLSLAGVAVLAKTALAWRHEHRTPSLRSLGWLTLFAAVAVLAVLTRLLHIRDLVLPAWVDSVHHTMIVRLLVAQGTLPETYAPYIPTGRFFYHWGYHAVTAWLAWFLNWTGPWAVAELVLQFGQFLNALTAVMLYAAGRVLFNSRRAGLLAATLAVLVSWFPAYYVSWGRYTHLTGLLLLPVLGIMAWRMHLRPTWGHWAATVLLGAGLLLTHIRVTFFALTWLAVLAGLLLGHRAWRTLGLWALTGVGVMLLTAPWMLSLASNKRFFSALASPPAPRADWWVAYNAIPWHLVWIPRNRELLTLATGGLSGLLGWGDAPLWTRIASGTWLLLLAGSFWVWRRHRLRHISTFPWGALGMLLAWCGVTAFLLNLDAVGLPPLWFMNNSAGVITLFLPLSLAGGGLLAWASGLLTPLRYMGWVTALLVLGIGVWGSRGMVDVVNPTTVLAEEADVRALRWIQANVPQKACFAVNVRPWLGHTYAGSDGGYWIPILTDRCSILPPALYSSAGTSEDIRQINDLLDQWAQADSLDDPALRARLRAAGVTHIYIGARGGHLQPERLLNRPFTRLIYQEGPVYIFELGDG